MSAPEKLFEGGPEWVSDGRCYHASLIGLTASLESYKWDEPNGLWKTALNGEWSGWVTFDKALAWLRTRILAHRDELNRITAHAPPPSDLTRAQELLRAWREAVDADGRLRTVSLKWSPSEDGGDTNYVCLEWYQSYPHPSFESADISNPNPLAAVRAAISMTPWADVTENK